MCAKYVPSVYQYSFNSLYGDFSMKQFLILILSNIYLPFGFYVMFIDALYYLLNCHSLKGEK